MLSKNLLIESPEITYVESVCSPKISYLEPIERFSLSPNFLSNCAYKEFEDEKEYEFTSAYNCENCDEID